MAFERVHDASIQYSTLPETVPASYPETVQNSYPEAITYDAKQAPDAVTEPWPESPPPRLPWWKRPKILLIVLGATVLLLLIVIGVVAGVLVSREKSYVPPPAPLPALFSGHIANPSLSLSLSRLRSKNNPPAAAGTEGPTAPTPTSVCRGTNCPSMIAVVDDTTPSARPGIKRFFALGQDQAIWTRRGDGAAWADDWTSLGGTFLSQPAAVNHVTTQTTVFAVDSNFNMLGKSTKDGAWDGAQWLNLAGGITAPPTVCSAATGSLDVFVRGTDAGLFRMNLNRTSGAFTSWLGEGGFLASAPVATCAGGGRIDVVLFGGSGPPHDLWIKRWDGTDFQAAEWFSQGGGFVGDPAAVSLGSDRTDYFGLGRDGAMYHKTWTAAAGFSAFENIGGPFQSAPYAVAVGTDRIDVLAVGKDDQLKHNALLGATWSADWQDLGGKFNSAPAAFVAASGRVSVYGLANNGSMFHGSWTIGSDRDWTNGTGWVSDQGFLSTRWFRNAVS